METNTKEMHENIEGTLMTGCVKRVHQLNKKNTNSISSTEVDTEHFVEW